ncbi:MAG: RNA methyltransferase [Treponema sp.]|nr:RNA methyltransferase [Treponema sp.]
MVLPEVIIILSRPAEAGNVGAVCRAMKNFGLSRLRIVKPEFQGDENTIRSRAVHAADIWERAENYSVLSDAVRDCALVIGTTRRRGRNRKQVTMTPEEVARFLSGRAQPVAGPDAGLDTGPVAGPAAIVFGNERTGLEDDEIALCNIASHIPVDEAFPSLNLSHAVQIYAYELFMEFADIKQIKGHWVPIDQERIVEKVREITCNLRKLGFYKQAGRYEQERFFRDIFSRAGITEKEAEYFAGLINRAVRLVEKKAT